VGALTCRGEAMTQVDEAITPPDKTLRYRALDGMRAVAILFVLSAHARSSVDMPAYPQWWWHLGDLGSLGVRIFFVLSGFIITHLLLRESSREGSISLRAFYIRRIFRIIPPVIVFMSLVGVGMALGYLQVPIKQFIMALVFLGNYVGASSGWTIGHLWSLAVEEQFYLFWPMVLAFTIRHARYRWLFIFTSLVLSPAIRVWGQVHGTGNPQGFIENSDALAMGALAAMIFSGAGFVRLSRFMESVPAWVSGLMILVFHYEPISEILKQALCYPLIHFCVAALILRVIRVERDPVAKLLSMRPLVFIGAISYSLYLFQQPVFNRPPLEMLPGFPWHIVLVFALAIASHYCVELPFMKWRERFL